MQETLLHAFERWKFGDVPDNPAAWLTRVAKNRAIDVLRRRATVTKNAPGVAAVFIAHAAEQNVEAHFALEVDDDVLRMMFSCCAPELAKPAQVAMILKALCGFSTPEIAAALLITPAATEKRLTRAKAALREHGLYDVTDATSLQQRLGAVQQAIYLLFNAGYHGPHAVAAVREDLCCDAMRLGEIVCAHVATDQPSAHALVALMCFLAARLQTRQDAAGDLLSLKEQDRTRWNMALCRAGLAHLERAARGDEVTPFALEAALASVHTLAPTLEATDWDRAVSLYDVMRNVSPSPVVDLNRAIAVSQRDGPGAGLDALAALEDDTNFARYPFVAAAKGDMLERLQRVDDARAAFLKAKALARNPDEKRYFARRLHALAPV